MLRHIPFEYIVPECALEVVAGVEENRVGPFGKQLFDGCVESRYPPNTFIRVVARDRSGCLLFKSDKIASYQRKIFIVT